MLMLVGFFMFFEKNIFFEDDDNIWWIYGDCVIEDLKLVYYI